MIWFLPAPLCFQNWACWTGSPQRRSGGLWRRCWRTRTGGRLSCRSWSGPTTGSGEWRPQLWLMTPPPPPLCSIVGVQVSLWSSVRSGRLQTTCPVIQSPVCCPSVTVATASLIPSDHTEAFILVNDWRTSAEGRTAPSGTMSLWDPGSGSPVRNRELWLTDGRTNFCQLLIKHPHFLLDFCLSWFYVKVPYKTKPINFHINSKTFKLV